MLDLKPTKLEGNVTIEKDYDETIIVPRYTILTIHGTTNRNISVEGGTVVLHGVANRINVFCGEVNVEIDGHCDSIYCGTTGSTVNIQGCVREVYACRGAKVLAQSYSNIVRICDDGAQVSIHGHAHVVELNKITKAGS